ncbi:MAG: EamA family transporter [Firmicutes bacterium]|nr:EamA family transporter [Bacillota bacterium]
MKSYAKLITSMLIWGTLPIFVTKIPCSSAETVMWRILFGTAFLLLVFALTKNKSDKAMYKKWALKLIFTGFFMGANWVFLFEAYKWVDVSIATLTYYMAPIIVMISSVFLFKESAGKFKIIGTAAAIAGMIIVTGVNVGGLDPMKGIFYGLASALCYASVTLLNKSTKGLSGLEMTIIQLIGAAIAVIPYTFITHAGEWLDLTSEAGIYAIIVGLVHTGVALFLYFSSIQELPAQTCALCSYIDPASALIFAAVLLGDALSPIQWVGALMILGGAAVGEILGGKRSKA